MDMALKPAAAFDFDAKLRATVDMFRLSKIERMLSDCLENMPDKSPVDYIGDLNKSDIMH